VNAYECLPTKLEQEFAKQFPGQTATYRHDKGTLILCQVSGATRKLHNTSTCLASRGFKLSNPKQDMDSQSRIWQTYRARNAKNNLIVKSIILDEVGNSWTSVEDWFWSAFSSSPRKTYLAISDIREESEY